MMLKPILEIHIVSLQPEELQHLLLTGRHGKMGGYVNVWVIQVSTLLGLLAAL